MTANKHLKSRVRDRMRRTGESYTSARRIVLAAMPDDPSLAIGARVAEVAGLVPEPATLRVLIDHAALTTPAGRPWSEAMLLGLTDGIGLSVHAFRYEREDVSTLFVGARRPDAADAMIAGIDRLQIPHTVHETSGTRAAARHLRDALDDDRAVAVWLDAATLGTRGLPARWEGGAYHVAAVLSLDDAEGTARLADLADRSVTVDLPTLAAARGRIRKLRHRVLALGNVSEVDVDLARAVPDAVGACHARLTAGRTRAMRIDALDDLARHMAGRGGRDSWPRMFPRGRLLWTALTSLHQFVEHYGTGGGLTRPLYARFLREASVATGIDLLDDAADRYDDLGRQWTALADAALPDDVDALAQARSTYGEQAALYAERGAAASAELGRLWRRIEDLGEQVARSFPLDEDGATALCDELARRTRAIADDERAAADVLRRIAHG